MAIRYVNLYKNRYCFVQKSILHVCHCQPIYKHYPIEKVARPPFHKKYQLRTINYFFAVDACNEMITNMQ